MSGKARTSRNAPVRAEPRRAAAASSSAATTTKTKKSGDLIEQRERFIQTFFRRGAELTEELIQEDAKLRKRLSDLEQENARLRAHVASDDAIRDLLAKIERLEKEKHELLSRFHDVEQFSTEHAERVADIEAENAKLASLYVASYQLHSTLDLPTVVRRIKELLAQFVGARALAIYVADPDRDAVVPIASEGVPPSSLHAVRGGEGAIGEAYSTGRAQWVEGDSTSGTVERPAACIPLRLADQPAGVIVVFATFEQKPSFVDVDFELFKLLGAHAAWAIVASRLFAQHGARIPPLDAFVDVE